LLSAITSWTRKCATTS